MEKVLDKLEKKVSEKFFFNIFFRDFLKVLVHKMRLKKTPRTSFTCLKLNFKV